MGHIISKEGISVDLKKVQVIVDWLTPNDMIDIWSFLGLDGFYRRFLIFFYKVASPLIELLKGNDEIEWASKMPMVWMPLKGLHYLPLILKLMEYGVVDMVLYIYVNNMVIKIVLM